MSAINRIVASAVLATALATGSAQASTLLPDGGFEAQGAASGISGSYCYGTDCASGAWTFAPLVGGSGRRRPYFAKLRGLGRTDRQQQQQLLCVCSDQWLVQPNLPSHAIRHRGTGLD